MDFGVEGGCMGLEVDGLVAGDVTWYCETGCAADAGRAGCVGNGGGFTVKTSVNRTTSLRSSCLRLIWKGYQI